MTEESQLDPSHEPRSKRRSPISREEGERRLLAAAIELIREKPFSEVGVRDIAARADVNHGFVHTWFGSKNDLMKRAVGDLLETIGRKIDSAPAGENPIQLFDPDIQLLVRLILWLKLENVDISGQITDRRVLWAIANRYAETEGMTPEVARVAAQQAVAMGIAAIAFGDFIELTSNEALAAFLDQWRHITGLLAKYPPA